MENVLIIQRLLLIHVQLIIGFSKELDKLGKDIAKLELFQAINNNAIHSSMVKLYISQLQTLISKINV